MTTKQITNDKRTSEKNTVYKKFDTDKITFEYIDMQIQTNNKTKMKNLTYASTFEQITTK